MVKCSARWQSRSRHGSCITRQQALMSSTGHQRAPKQPRETAAMGTAEGSRGWPGNWETSIPWWRTGGDQCTAQSPGERNGGCGKRAGRRGNQPPDVDGSGPGRFPPSGRPSPMWPDHDSCRTIVKSIVSAVSIA